MTYLWLTAGLVVLVLGADLFVRGASSLALRWGVSPLVVGLTVVALGTSAPEVAVSVRAAWVGQADIAIGNVVGSNLFNILCVLGLSALVAPLTVSLDLVRRDIPVMIVVSLALLLLTLHGVLAPWSALLLLVGLAGYILWLIRNSRRVSEAITPSQKQVAVPLAFAFLLAGLTLLVLGAGWLVDSAVSIARLLGVSELVIGLTIVSAGTSLPELATSVVAAARGERDIAVGNAIGSNIFNMLFVLGAAGSISGTGLPLAPDLRVFDFPVMAGVALLCYPLCRSGFTLSRGEGIYLVLGYLLYSGALVARATGSPALLSQLTWAWLVIGLVAGAVFARRAGSRRVAP